MKIFICSVLCFLTILVSHGQGNQNNFGEVSREALMMENYDLDTSAFAVTLFDKGHSEFNLGPVYPAHFKKHTRVKVFKKEVLGIGTKRILVEHGGLYNLKGVVYNLEGDSIIESRLEQSSIFKNRITKEIDEITFTLPEIKDGSVFEFSYETKGNVLQGWQFQNDIPTMWSEYSLNAYNYSLYFRKHFQGLIPVKIHEERDNYERWVLTNIPAFKPEPLMLNKEDYVSRVDFIFSSSWLFIAANLLSHENFGLATKKLKYPQAELDKLLVGINDSWQKLREITNYVKNNLKWNEVEDVWPADLKNIFKRKSGTAADLNFTLAAILRKAGFEVDMVLLKTRGNGFIKLDLPTVQQFDYVICLTYADSVGILLDATEKYLPWNILPERCLNGKGFIVSKDKLGWIEIQPTIKSKTAVNSDVIVNNLGTISGSIKIEREGYDAFHHRLAFNKMGEESYLTELKKDKNWNLVTSEFDNMENTENSTKEIHEISYDGHATTSANFIYLSPFIKHQLEEENPFKSDRREYPVSFVTINEKVYLSTIAIPSDFIVVEVPKEKIMVLPNNAAKFTFSVTSVGEKIQVVSNIQINQTLFTKEEYPDLKELYNRIIAKHAEQIILKRK